MLGKKLVTLACVLGILACGACFGPAYRPPIVRPLPGARTIQVVVTNVSSGHHLDSGRFASEIVDWFNNGYHEGISSGSMRATVSEYGSPDAVLKVVILKESAHKMHGLLATRDTWNGSVTISATLTVKDGSVLWNEREVTLAEDTYLPQQTSFAWDSPNSIAIWLERISQDLTDKVLYLNRP